VYHFAVAYPADTDLLASGTIAPNSEGRVFRMKVATPPEGISMTGSQTCWNAPEVFIAQFGEIPTSSPSVDMTVDPTSWHSVPVGLTLPAGLPSQVLGLGPAVLLPSESATVPMPWSLAVPLIGSSWTGTLHTTPEQHSRITTSLWLRATSAQPVADAPPAASVEARVIRDTADGIVFSPYRTIGPAAYVAHRGELLNFGAGLAHAETTAFADAGVLSAGATWVGSLGELRGAAAQSAVVTVRDGTGEILTTGPSISQFQLPGDGAYTVELNETQTFAGLNAETRATSIIDSSRSDTAAPSLRCLRIVDGNGRSVENLGAGTRGWMRFAAIDLIWDSAERTGTFGLVLPEKTIVRWRTHGVGQWQPLAFDVEAREIVNSRQELDALGHDGAGVVFGCDLSAVTATARGAVDVEIHVEDASGNTLDYLVAPAFAVNGGKRRAVAH
jgi:hypothetical protein